ncbi:N-acetyltransferase GCN5 [Cellulomonas chitinilytica]|uniref:N-acetyltransferase GCN5 n=1 Tax=Cellulomonas chitinilytica TaxID=398759 RepID=A0A919P2A2_9CELL|nr:GNAT family N-acetyltransferase [Cellulomonas chitinilytica]GIG22076.1 N-acetyltransferase GCN5 [Cellulomonas chitinilytica]
MTRYTRPAPLLAHHDRSAFRCGVGALDGWFHDRALKNEAAGGSRTFVTLDGVDGPVVGYYSLASSSVELSDAPGPVRRNMPDPIPVILLGRLAVDDRHQGAGLGASLLQDAIRRIAVAADVVGVRAVLVHAIDDAAASFYRRHGFAASPIDEQTLFLPMKAVYESIREVVP